MNLNALLRILSDYKCDNVYVKRLSANDNSKNQVYFGGNFDALNIFPIKEITTDSDNKGGGKKTRFKTKLDFYWANELGEIFNAPEAQLILYPKYPEVRFSGFLHGVKEAPSELMTGRTPDRLLFLGVGTSSKVIGYVTGPESPLAKEFLSLNITEEIGVFKSLTLVGSNLEYNSKGKLLQELKRIHRLGWINSKRLDAHSNIFPCNSTNCGGYTLESELGITPNGYSEPDYLGWEIKQFGVKNFKTIGAKAVTLMTPEPTDGMYVTDGLEKFITKYGYNDKRGREARINFGGRHFAGIFEKTTKLKLILEGYDADKQKIENTGGFLGLIDKNENIAASWSFTSLLKHWNTKHAKACYVPSQKQKTSDPVFTQQYSYGNLVMLGIATDFSLFLREVALGNIYYDPGIKLELEIPNIRKQSTKRRSQFRISVTKLTNLYKENEVVNLLETP